MPCESSPATVTLSPSCGTRVNWPGKYSVVIAVRTQLSVNTALLRIGFAIGSRSSQRRRKPSASGALGDDWAGVK